MYEVLDFIAGTLHGANGGHLLIALVIIVVVYVRTANRKANRD
ncbi:hypothetical protein TIN4_91 [Tsukamurella phage TIN4]|uniref:Uncharacterized protein n=2 Tax=Tinduovirus TIN3 TaxID=1982571 RepID=A0A0K0N6E6_9CAUD|nr:hypothetical protein AVT54_gp034 [Tsukamurella phage TIN3]YP_009604221.1 hypothetical protein FDH87_gp034 [Tsukamurella phage TIN4]AKJ71888.1 hypothetical protein TIN3_91 [Tsukamurella phage TIN3]AKJ71997.1 hypothetical protein TIN4_91 [Tsukamurella phage TIN4]